jgi:hypothetical protein
MTKLQRLLALLGLVALAALPLQASPYDDDGSDDEDDIVLTEEQRLTPEQKARLAAAEVAAKRAAVLAERAAKTAAAAADRAARRAAKPVRGAVKAEGKYNIELAKLTEDQGVLDSALTLAGELGTDLTVLPTLEEILAAERDESLADAAFYRSLIPMTAGQRVAALASRPSDDDDDLDYDVLAGFNELQLLILEATDELADELADVAEAYASWQDKLALSLLSPADYAAEIALRAAAKRSRLAELRALPRPSQVWLRKAWSAEEDAAEAAAALEWLGRN